MSWRHFGLFFNNRSRGHFGLLLRGEAYKLFFWGRFFRKLFWSHTWWLLKRCFFRSRRFGPWNRHARDQSPFEVLRSILSKTSTEWIIFDKLPILFSCNCFTHRTEVLEFESRQGVRFFGLYILKFYSLWLSLHCYCTYGFEWNKMSKWKLYQCLKRH
jgi:hypothetical protein